MTKRETEFGAPRARGAGRVTMTDVAKAAGCSQATVSFVLNRAPGVKISPDTRARVIEAARALGYAAPSFAHLDAREPGPAGPAHRTIAFLVDQIATSPEAVVAIEGARQSTWPAGDVVLIAQTMNNLEMEAKTVRSLIAHGADALIYMTIFTRRVDLSPSILDLSVPVTLLNCYTADGRFPAVVPGEVEGGQAATRHLIEHGHRRIGHITGEPWMEAARDRLKGYGRALAGACVPFDPALVVRGDWSASSGFSGTRALLALPDPPSAIFCQNDRMAIGAYEALKEAGLRIPEDVSVVGYDDEEIARHLHPQLTTVVLPHRAMGAWAAERCRLAGAEESHAPIRLDCPLVRRMSVVTRGGAAAGSVGI